MGDKKAFYPCGAANVGHQLQEQKLTENPYATPNAEVRDAFGSSKIVKLYSPIQVACGTIGGPVGLIYFLKANFAALGYHQLERRTLLAGFVLMPALLISTILLPEDFPGFPFAIAYIVSALYVSSRHQMTRKAILDSPNHEFHSNWRVLGIGILCLAISAIILIAPIAALFLFGVSDI